MAAEDVEQISTPAPSYHSNFLSFSSSSFNADLEQALLEYLRPLPAYNRDGTYAPPNTPAPTEEKTDDAVVIVKSKKVEIQRGTENREERDHEDPWFTIRGIILALISCVALVVGPCVFAL